MLIRVISRIWQLDEELKFSFDSEPECCDNYLYKVVILLSPPSGKREELGL